MEIFVASWRTACLRWTVEGGQGGRDGLTDLIERTFALLPDALTCAA
ncbi:hypothetical protein ACFY9A_24820 [Streptomyces rubradiris]